MNGEFLDRQKPIVEAFTPKLGTPSGRRPQLPAFSFGVMCHNDGIVGNLFGDKFHSRVFECLSKHRVTEGRQRMRKLIISWPHSQSLSTTSEPRVCIAGYGKSSNITYSLNWICALGRLVQEVEVLELFGSPL